MWPYAGRQAVWVIRLEACGRRRLKFSYNISTSTLLAKLNSYGIDRNVLNRTGRAYQVHRSRSKSMAFFLTSGVRQDPIVGPFLLIMNGLPSALGYSAFLFADNAKIMFIRVKSNRPIGFPLLDSV